nr:MAG TPA_asm: hypothetical protein [Caudoviricetes sp.]
MGLLGVVLVVVHLAQVTQDLCVGLNRVDNVLVVLVRHRGLVDRTDVHRGRVHVLHRFLVLVKRDVLAGLGTGHQSSSPVRKRVVPVRVALALDQKRAVSHVKGNDADFPIVGADCTLADDALAHRCVVVDAGGRNLVHVAVVPAHAVADHVVDAMVVEQGPKLKLQHVGQIVVTVFPVKIDVVLVNLGKEFTHSLIVLGCVGVTKLAHQLVITVAEFLYTSLTSLLCDILIIVSHEDAQGTRPTVDKKICVAVVVHVNRTHVVARAQRAHRETDTIFLCVVQGVPELQIAIRERARFNRFAGVNVEASRQTVVNNLVKLLKVILYRELGRKLEQRHTATDIDADSIRGNLIREGDGGTDNGSLARMAVGHDSNSLVTVGDRVAKLLYLLFKKLVGVKGKVLNVCHVSVVPFLVFSLVLEHKPHIHDVDVHILTLAVCLGSAKHGRCHLDHQGRSVNKLVLTIICRLLAAARVDECKVDILVVVDLETVDDACNLRERDTLNKHVLVVALDRRVYCLVNILEHALILALTVNDKSPDVADIGVHKHLAVVEELHRVADLELFERLDVLNHICRLKVLKRIDSHGLNGGLVGAIVARIMGDDVGLMVLDSHRADSLGVKGVHCILGNEDSAAETTELCNGLHLTASERDVVSVDKAHCDSFFSVSFVEIIITFF